MQPFKKGSVQWCPWKALQGRENVKKEKEAPEKKQMAASHFYFALLIMVVFYQLWSVLPSSKAILC